MTCEQAIELLPWYLNGTLEGQEHEEVRGHLETCEACRTALAETREAGRIFTQHLPSEALVALAYGETPAGLDSALAERHLESCPECAADLELARMSRQLEDDRIAVFPAKGRRETAGGYRTWRGAAMAASLTGLIAFGGWFHSAGRNQQIQQKQDALEAEMKGQQSELSQLAQEMKPQIELNTWNQSLPPEERTRGESAEIRIPGNHAATPHLTASREVGAPEREIAILDSDGKPAYQAAGLHRDKDTDDFTFMIPRGFLKPGRYTIQLYTRENGKQVPRESYKIRVE
jgi:predicted anti-sigma-YlaC factor YlaD